jgi:DNA-directed RNA polymerase specialized sigma24 family protein
MRPDDFDLDVTDSEDARHAQRVSALDPTTLIGLIAGLPHDLQGAATGVLVEGRTFSDVSQELGIRQPELVRAVHRSRALISRQLEGTT